MDRPSVVAGQFYPGSATELSAMVREFLDQAEPAPPLAANDQPAPNTPPIAVMVPHAGYVYSGVVAGMTLGAAPPHPTVLLMGPNHTGMGAPVSLWDSGRWALPGGGLDVDEELASAIASADPHVTPDRKAHLREHSLEVVLPFLRELNPDTTIVPMAIADSRGDVLVELGTRIAEVIRNFPRPVTMVVSSDMNHFADDETTRKLDAKALERIASLDPKGLVEVVQERNITMCGVLPMTVALVAALSLGATVGRIMAYDTSARAACDTSRVVGYAGVIIR